MEEQTGVLKRCPKCNRDLPVTEFHRHSQTKDGLKNYCKGCNKATARDYYHRNIAKTRASKRLYTRDHREENKARSKRWREQNPQQFKSKRDAWRQNNAERHRQSNAEWREANRERYREQMRRAKLLRKVGKNKESAIYARILYADPCSYCGDRSASLDHIQAVSQGGGNGCENLTGACMRCNAAKQDKPLLLFLRDHWLPESVRGMPV